MIDITLQNFENDLLQDSMHQPILLDIWAPWCGPCRSLGPILEKLETAYEGRFKLAKLNSDEQPEIAGQLSQAFGVRSIPFCVMFHQGQPVDGFVGALPESQVKAFIDRLGGPAGAGEVELLVEEGNRLLAANDVAAAAEHFAAALATDAASLPALVGLASCHLATGNLDAARQTLAAVPAAAANDPAVAAVRARIDLAAQTAALGDPAALAARVAANPKDHDARFDLALIANAGGDRETALDHLLAIVARDRGWSDEKARKQLVQFFEAWGPMDEATLSGRRRLSSLLFS